MSKQQSTFVSALAWSFILLAGFATFVSAFQNIMLFTVFPTDIPEPKDMEFPFILRFLFDNIRLYFFGIFVITSVTFVSALGLLKRKEWARKTFVGILGFAIFYLIAAGVFQHVLLKEMSSIGAPMGEAEMSVLVLIQISTFIMIAGLGGLFAWIIKRLISPKIKAEFQP